jgi:hypothetical protein
MNTTKLFFKSVRRILFIILGIASAIVFVKNLWLNDVPELFSKGSEIGSLIEKLSFAYIGSFVFYLLVTHQKSFFDKLKVNSFIEARVRNVIGCGTGMLNTLSNAAGVNLAGTWPTNEELHTICTNINPQGNSPMLAAINGPPASWLLFLKNQKDRNDKFSKDVLNLMPYLDASLVRIITNVNNCTFFSEIEMLNSLVKQAPLANQNLTSLENNFAKYLQLIKQLEDYRSKKLESYRA